MLTMDGTPRGLAERWHSLHLLNRTGLLALALGAIACPVVVWLAATGVLGGLRLLVYGAGALFALAMGLRLAFLRFHDGNESGPEPE